jgi:hypothetical protein
MLLGNLLLAALACYVTLSDFDRAAHPWGGAAGDMAGVARLTCSMPLLAAKTLARYLPTIFITARRCPFQSMLPNRASKRFVGGLVCAADVGASPTHSVTSAHKASRRDAWVGHSNTACSNVSSAPVLQQGHVGDVAFPFWCSRRAVCNISALHNSSALCGAVIGPNK